jgi:hypothetical protein
VSKSISRSVPMPRHRWHRLPVAFGRRKGHIVAVLDCLCLECGLLRRTTSRGSNFPTFRLNEYFRRGVKLGNLAPECPGESLRHHA